MSKSMEGLIALFFLCFPLFSISRSMAATQDTLTPGQPIKDGETLVSADERFELGLFSPANSTTQFLGIWYKKISSRTYVWVANRKSPIMTTSGVFKINDQGILILFNGHNQVIWSSNTSRTAQNPSAQLLDSGNFVVRDSKGNVLWQSFDYPSHTLLAGMKLGRNLAMDLDWSLTAWKSLNDPAPGDFSFWLDPRGFPQLVITNRTAIQFRMGSWNGLHFTGSPQLKQNPIYSFQFVSNKHEIYYMYELKNNSLATMAVLNEAGIIQRYVSVDRTHTWNLFFAVPIDRCDSYALCGAYASCNSGNYPFCACLEGFVPKSPSDWEQADWSHGCVRKTKLDCHNGDGFWKRTGLKLPDTSSAWVNESLSLKECEAICLRNCSCVAYANLDVRGGGSGCLLWFHNLIDMREFIEGGQDLYIRMAASELARLKARKKSNENRKDGIIVGCLIFIMGMLMLALFFYMRKRKHKQHGMMNDDEMRDYDKDSAMEEMELPIFDLAIIKDATNNFSRNNKLGEGGFGPVFKGILSDGKEIAVKRLSKSSGQGSTEFKNEVILISKLQHRNLVKLLGCCIQKDEKMLIYEFMPNKSLDFFIFDQMRSNFLDWDKRYHIIGGIARGLLYLHQDSRLRIIHRDLKASNVLLDKDMNPKISDFGLARIFGGDQTEANTNKVAGTYGYMSPEYAVDGLFSMKSDVFSFGVLVLEIVSGKKNRGFSHPNHNHNLLGHAWKLWIAEKSMELVDNMLDSFVVPEVVRCIQVGLLCVQQRPEDRPNMSSVVVMLGSESILPQPKLPGFFTERIMPEAEGLISKDGSSSINEMSTTIIEPR